MEMYLLKRLFVFLCDLTILALILFIGTGLVISGIILFGSDDSKLRKRFLS